MKKIILGAMLMLFAVGSLSAQDKGVKFETGTLKEMLAKASSSGKYLFVDVYTTWCGPCKYMTGRVFPQEAVGTYFNQTFVNTKFDAEAGEGIEVAKKYGVSAYPTFLILDATGKEVGRIVGGDEPGPFVQKVKGVVAKIQ